jgi:hypothetical protein
MIELTEKIGLNKDHESNDEDEVKDQLLLSLC